MADIESNLTDKTDLTSPISMEDIEDAIDATFFEYSYKYQYLIVAIAAACLAYCVQGLSKEKSMVLAIFLLISIICYALSILTGLKALSSSLKSLRYVKNLDLLKSRKSTKKDIDWTRQDLSHNRKKYETYAKIQYNLLLVGTIIFGVFLLFEMMQNFKIDFF